MIGSRLPKLIVDTMSHLGYKQQIEGGTHEQNGKLSCIDLIFTNKSNKVKGAGTGRVRTHYHLVYVDR